MTGLSALAEWPAVESSMPESHLSLYIHISDECYCQSTWLSSNEIAKEMANFWLALARPNTIIQMRMVCTPMRRVLQAATEYVSGGPKLQSAPKKEVGPITEIKRVLKGIRMKPARGGVRKEHHELDIEHNDSAASEPQTPPGLFFPDTYEAVHGPCGQKCAREMMTVEMAEHSRAAGGDAALFGRRTSPRFAKRSKRPRVLVI